MNITFENYYNYIKYDKSSFLHEGNIYPLNFVERKDAEEFRNDIVSFFFMYIHNEFQLKLRVWKNCFKDGSEVYSVNDSFSVNGFKYALSFVVADDILCANLSLVDYQHMIDNGILCHNFYHPLSQLDTLVEELEHFWQIKQKPEKIYIWSNC